MKCKIIIIWIILTVASSCTLPRYVFENKGQTTGLDFTKGKWLINNIDSPSEVSVQLTKKAKDDFENYLSNRLFFIYEPKGIILPKKITMNPSKGTLIEIKKGTNFDFFINIRAGKIKDELGLIDTTPHNFYTDRNNQSEVVIEIYDLNLAQIIYSQKVIGTVSSIKSNEDVKFYKSTQSLILGCYKKLIRDIKQKSIK
ncbi:hypothetical protein [Flavobacterium luteum]|uniref:Lipoprotein n=1 Tax=Flavobacterium luteum TaxID=2026654 RepID=A0A7J5AGI2_9FLAO|nr:hypothetical protein [Flavobacterium luteum]KAB1156701.1 hypothetical protein F6464_04935 [Flavobacterium luteum]